MTRTEAIPTSRLIVLLVTDIVGSTDLKGRIGLSSYAKLLAGHDALFKQLIASTAAAEILKDTGDGYFASFVTTSDAVRFALRFQHDLSQVEGENSRSLKVRVGIHVGEVAQMDAEQTGKPKLVGIAADLAARVTHLAMGGQVLLTRFAFNEARQFVSSLPVAGGMDKKLTWIAHGPYRLRGADEVTEIFEVGIEDLSPLVAPTGSDDARRVVPADDEDTLGWRPAVGLEIPGRPNWMLQRRLGEGGFGEVWLAQHAKLASRRVFKFCFDADRLRSFKRELTLFRLLREAFGERKDIARLHEIKLDAAPYFIESDYAQGGDLHEWAQKQGGLAKVSLDTRLDILARVADAVAAAHSVGVLHKDLKPSNILIAIDDEGAPRPKIADFGVGALTDRSKLHERAITEAGFTQFTIDASSSQTGTRLYAPPEVLTGRPFTVQGDIYALGVILYQVVIADLTRPIAEGWERDVSDELLREDIAVCVEGDPARRLSSAGDLAKRIRALGPRRQWNMKQAEQERLTARRARIHRIATAASIAMLVLLALLGSFALHERSLRKEAERARAAEAKQRRIASGVSDFLDRMVTSIEPDSNLGGKDVTMVRALDNAYDVLQSRRAAGKKNEPEVDAAALKTMGRAYRVLGQLDRGEKLLRESLELSANAVGPTHPDTAEIRAELAVALFDAGKFKDAEPFFGQAANDLERSIGWEHNLTLSYALDHALNLLKLQQLHEAEQLSKRVYESRVKLEGADSDHAITALETQAGLANERGDYPKAADLFLRVYQARQRANGEQHPLTLLAGTNAATLMYRTGRAAEAEPILSRILALQIKTLGESHPRTLVAMENHATVLDELGRTEEAIAEERKALEIRQKSQGPNHPDTLGAQRNLAALMMDHGHAVEAIQMLSTALEPQKEALGETHPEVLRTMNNLASAYNWNNDFAHAQPIHQQVIAISTKAVGATHPDTITFRMNYAGALVKEKLYEQAEREYKLIWEDAQAQNIPAATRFRIATRLWRLYDVMQKPDLSEQFKRIAATTTRPSGA